MTDIPPRYNPKHTEHKWYKFWEENKFFHAEADPSKRPFCIVIPPPNITGILHMGHALNNTIQDIIIRTRRMQGLNSLWMPGTDHAGIATQNVVERELMRENLRRQDLGREKFLERVWQWREEYGSTIIQQLKKLGCSCDWERTRFTMDKGYTEAVLEAFIRLYQKGLIYQGEYIINWCPRCQTALSDEEAPHKEINGYLYYIEYPIKKPTAHSSSFDKLRTLRRRTLSEVEVQPTARKSKSIIYQLSTINYIVVATTRPETMLGDTAVAVNPKDRRYKNLIGKTVILPLIEREIKIIADNFVEPKFGTGCVKVTPAHDSNDFQIARRHRLESVLVMNPDGTMNKEAGDYQGMDRFEAREAILEDLKERKLFIKSQPHVYSAGHCYRCHTMIEPYLSRQWFVKMKPLAKPAIEVVKKGKVKFYPKRWMKVYLNWMENIQDWCISRQIWWGHRLPVYYCRDCQKQTVHSSEFIVNRQKLRTTNYELRTKGVIVSRTQPKKCPKCASTQIIQDGDVLDTWFSSWLWPFATFYWPFTRHTPHATRHTPLVSSVQREACSVQQSELNYFYPTQVLVTAPEILFFWVARMIMSGLEFMDDIPFRDVYIHGTVRDITGKKMSKSLGNIIDPLEIIQEFGCDALRFSLISITAAGQDVFLSKEKFQTGRNFANKIWNASRFILMNLDRQKVSVDLCVFTKGTTELKDRWILSRFYQTLESITKSLESFRFNEAAKNIYEFFWHEFCDWYIELSKKTISISATQLVLYKVLEKALRILHPFMPFITEEIWQNLPHPPLDGRHLTGQEEKSIMLTRWPHMQRQFIDKKAERQMQTIISCISAIRNIRSVWQIDTAKKIEAKISLARPALEKLIKSNASYIQDLAKIELIQVGGKIKRPESSAVAVLTDIEIFIPLEGIIDVGKEAKRLKKKIQGLENFLQNSQRRLKNKQFLSKAPKDVLIQQKEKTKQLKESIRRLKENLKGFRL